MTGPDHPAATAPQSAIDTHAADGFRFGGFSHQGSLLALPSGMFAWSPSRASEVTEDSLHPALDPALGLDLLLIGLGASGAGLDAGVLGALRDRGIEVEVTRTALAVGTYNAMLSDGRRVGAALLPPVPRSG